ncbi:MAG: hypothetical protein ACTSSK_03075 [Candidatus Heimdallarchaeota archaeon]
MIIENFALIEIGRKEGASALQIQGLTEELVKTLLIEALPLGNPENEFFKITKIENKLFLSSLILDEDKDYGLALIVEFDDGLQNYNPICLIDSLNSLLKTCLLNKEKSLAKSLEFDYNEIEQSFDVYENFDNFIFSILSEQNTLILGEKDELKSFLANFYEYIPNELKKYLTLIANSSKLNNKVGLQALVLSDEILKVIDTKKGEYSTLFLPMKTAYGAYTSPFCKKVALLFADHKKESIKEELIHFFKLAIESKEIVPTADYAAAIDLPLADASLLLWMRANHYDIKLEKSFFEQLS